MASPPSPPDPKVTAAAEASGNVNTAIANTIMGNANTTNFDGSTTNYQQIGTQQVSDGNGGLIDVPRYSVQNNLSAENQHLYGQRQHATSIAQDAAIQGLHRINANTRTPLDFAGAPEAGSVTQAPTLGSVGSGPQLQSGIQTGQIQNSLAPISQEIASTVNLNPLDQQFQTSFASAGNIPTAQQLGSNFSFGAGGMGQVNAPALQSTYDTTQAQTTFDQGPQVSQTFGQTGPMANNVSLDRVGTDFGPAGDIQMSMGPQDWSADRQRVEEALYSRLNPQFDRQRVATEERLRNQGLTEGTEAWNRRLDEIGRQENDARMQTVLAGGQEQSRLAGLSQMQGQFANQAQAQSFDQAQARGLYGINATGFNNNQTLQEGQFQNAAQAQAYSQAMGRGQFANTAAGQIYNQNLGAAQFGNQAIGQNNQTAAGLAAFNNQARAQEQNFGIAQGQLGIQGQAANNQAAAQLAALQLQGQQQQYNQNMGQASFYNDATAQQAALQAQNNQYALQQGQFQNAAQQQAFAQSLAGGQFANQSQQQAYEQQLAQAGLYNASQQQQYQNELTGAGFNNAAAGQQFNMQQAQFDAQNALRANSIQETMMQRNQPINEWAALMGGTQMQLPQNGQYRSGQVAPVDYSNIVNQSYQAELQAANSFNSGLFSLGGTLAKGMFRFPVRLSNV